MTSICLGMIVRDTETKGKNVGRAIRSTQGFCDRAVIIDTGSLDNTMQVVTETCAEVGLPLELMSSEWVSHTHNRTELLALCRTKPEIDWVLMLDADMELVITGDLPDLNEKDEWMITIEDRGMDYPLPLLTSNHRDFAYAGPTHSHLIVNDIATRGPLRGDRLWNAKLVDHGGGGGGGKIENDLIVLREAVAENPADSRSWFYLAQTYRDLDMIAEAIHAYQVRAMLGGWDEEVYNSLYWAGKLTSDHVSYLAGAKLLISAFEQKPNRAEALRALAARTTIAADKIPYPHEDTLFIERGCYTALDPGPSVPIEPPSVVMPPQPSIKASTRALRRKRITVNDVTAIIVTRGNVSLDPILETLPYPEVIVWNNSEREHDQQIYGRYAAIPEASNPVIYYQDDDVIFTHHDELLAEWEPGIVTANMDSQWLQGAGYHDTNLVMLGAGSLVPAQLPEKIFREYFKHHPWDAEVLIEADFAFGILCPSKRIELPYATREFSDDLDRLYQQPWQLHRKWNMIARAQALRNAV